MGLRGRKKEGFKRTEKITMRKRRKRNKERTGKSKRKKREE